MPDLAIDLTRITKLYKRKIRALDGIAMQVRRGEVFGLLGPNGAGKSTLVKIIMSVVTPTEAHGSVLNHPVGSKPSLQKVGYLPEHHRFPRYLTGRQTLEFFAALSGIDRPTRIKRSRELLDTVGMTNWADTRIAAYSKGMLQRIGIAAALVNNPDLVLLDEPTDGVDPAGRREIRDVLLRMKSEGTTVFVNSHLLSELEVISDRVAILVGGRVVQQGTLDELTLGRQFFEIELDAPVATPLNTLAEQHLHVTWTPATTSSLLKGTLPSGLPIELDGNLFRLDTAAPADIQPLIDALRAAKLPIKRIQSLRPSLEDLFMEAVGGIAGAHQAGASLNTAPTGARP